jgi:hypothetical protein
MQALRQIIRPIVDRLGDPEHLGAGLGAEPPVGVERLRDGSDRDAGEPRNIADGPGSRRDFEIAGLSAIRRKIVHLTAPESSPET